MVWACSPLGLWRSKTKQEDTQPVASQISLRPWPGPSPSLPCHLSVLLPLTLLTIQLYSGLGWHKASALHITSHCWPCLPCLCDTGNCLPWACCAVPLANQGSCHQLMPTSTASLVLF